MLITASFPEIRPPPPVLDLYPNQYLQKVLHPWQNQPALETFWPRSLAPNQQTDIVLADTSSPSSMYPVPVNPYGLGYSIIAYLPNPSHTADALIIAGTDSQATDAAGESLTSEGSLSGFLNRLHTKPFPHFELLLKTTRLSGTPFNAEVIAYRTLENDSAIPTPK